MKDKQVIKKDKHCIGCKHFWTCKGKPHSNPCLNKENSMREILFKAKRKNWKELPKKQWWVKGYLWNGNDHSYIIPYNFGIGYDSDTNSLRATAYEIDKDTICQYTGLTDKNGNKIWENDVVKFPDCDMSTESGYGDCFTNVGKIAYYMESISYFITNRITVDMDDIYIKEEVEVIGNIFDNEDLLQ